ncbi:MAG TPA: cation transporter [Candidatus Methanoperedens sp.]|nr:cation transporter [Candidatus Methanoperedens sp.]
MSCAGSSRPAGRLLPGRPSLSPARGARPASPDRERLLRRANALALVTIFYNILEGLISVGFGLEDETLALFGFGVDSFVEVVSGIGIWHLVRRLRTDGGEAPDRFERHALRVTGTAFFLLAGGLTAVAAVSIARGGAPESTFWGTVVALVSILTMGLLIRAKVAVGRALGSAAILADAACTRACLLLSFVLLASSLGYRLTGIGGLDAAGAIGIAWFALREGREAFGKARGELCSCAGCGDSLQPPDDRRLPPSGKEERGGLKHGETRFSRGTP